MRAIFQSEEMLEKNFSEAFCSLSENDTSLKIITRDGNLLHGSKTILRLFSPILNSVFKDIPCCKEEATVIFLPEVGKDAVSALLNIVRFGKDDSTPMSTELISEVTKVATMFGIDLKNTECVEKRIFSTEAAFVEKSSNINVALSIKAEYSERVNDEALLKTDSEDSNCGKNIKEEPLEMGEIDSEQETDISKNADEVRAPSFSAPSKPQDSVVASCINQNINEKGHNKSKKNISEETLSALIELMRQERTPTVEEMEKLLSCTQRFKDSVVDQDTKRKESSKSPDVEFERSRSRTRRSSSKDKKNTTSTGEKRYPTPTSSVPMTIPSPVQYVSATQRSSHSQQPNQMHPQIQYMVHQGGAVQAMMPGTVPFGLPIGSVPGLEHVQYMIPQSSVQIKARTPSPGRRNSPSDFDGEEDNHRYKTESYGPKRIHRSMADKKASLMAMTASEKQKMTCRDWNNGHCPRLDNGKLCVFAGSKKKHICSKIVKSSYFGGSKVCWGTHRELEHVDPKDRFKDRKMPSRGEREFRQM